MSMIDNMVDRFLGWKLPNDFYPDAGVKFEPTELQKSGVHPWPVGTNLFAAYQARAMFEHCIPNAEELVELRTDNAALMGAIKEVVESEGGRGFARAYTKLTGIYIAISGRCEE